MNWFSRSVSNFGSVWRNWARDAGPDARIKSTRRRRFLRSLRHEPFEDRRLLAALTAVDWDADGNLRVADIAADGKDDALDIRLAADTVVISDAKHELQTSVGFQPTPNEVAVPAIVLAGKRIVVSSGAGDDGLRVELSAGPPVLAGIEYLGGSQRTTAGDRLEIVSPSGGVQNQEFTFQRAGADGQQGQVTLDGLAITFTGLEPISGGDAANTVFNLPADVWNGDAVLRRGAVAGRIEMAGTTFETTDVPNPTASLSIRLGDQGNVLQLQPLDPAFNAAVNVTGGRLIDRIAVVDHTGAGTYRIDGGDGQDDITAADAANAWQITGPNAGRVEGLEPFEFLNVENLTGGTDSDTFAVQEGGQLAGVLDGGPGRDTLDYSALGAGADVLVDLATAQASRIFASAPGGLAAVENVIGGAGNDTLTGDGGDNELSGGAGADVLADGAGNDVLRGGIGGDRFLLSAAGADQVFDAEGQDAVEFLAAWGVTFDLDSHAVQDLDGSGSRRDTVTLAEGVIEEFYGTDADDTLRVDALLNAARQVYGRGGTGDVLEVDAQGADVTDTGTELTFSGGFGSLAYTGWERIRLLNTTRIIVSGGSGNDSLVVQATGAKSGSYTLDGGPVVEFTALNAFEFDGQEGNDTLTIVNPLGVLFAPAEGVQFDGGPQSLEDRLILNGAGGAGFQEAYGAGPAAGAASLVTKFGSTTQTVGLTGLEVVETTLQASLTATANDDNNHLEVLDGDAGRGRLTIDAFPAIEFANKAAVTVDALDGSDRIAVDFSQVPSGLRTLSVRGGDGENRFDVLAVPALAGGLDLVGGSDGDTINIQSVAAVTRVAGGDGADVINISSDAPAQTGSLDHLLAPVNIDVGSGANRLDISDLGEATVDANRHVVIGLSTITGLAGPNDDISINYQGEFTGTGLIRVQGADSPAASEQYDIDRPAGRLELSTNDGDDGITVRGLTYAMQVDGGEGNDRYLVSSDGTGLTGNLDNLLAELTIRDALGRNSLALSDQSSRTADMVTLGVAAAGDGTATATITGLASSPVHYGPSGGFGGGVRITGTDVSWGDSFLIQGTLAGGDTVVDAGAGNDVVEVYAGATEEQGNLDAVGGTLQALGGAGKDSLLLSDAGGTTANAAVEISADRVRGFAAADDSNDVAYRDIETLTLLGNANPEKFQILATSAATTVRGGGGNDAFLVGDVAGTLSGLAAGLTVDGGDSNPLPQTVTAVQANGRQVSVSLPSGDTLEVHDEGYSLAASYTLTATTVQRIGAAAVNFTTVERIALAAGQSTNEIAVAGTANGSGTSISGGPGVDRLQVSGTGVQSLLRLETWAGADEVHVAGTGESSVLQILTGDDADLIELQSGGSNSGIQAETGEAGDHLIVTATGTGSVVQLASGAGTDQLELLAAAATSDCEILAGTENDIIRLASAAHSVAGLLGPIHVSGDGHDAFPQSPLSASAGSQTVSIAPPTGDTLVFDDSGYTGAATYALTATSLRRDALGSVTYEAVETIQVLSGKAANSISVGGTPADSSTSISAGNAADRITVSGTGQASGLTIQAAGGADEISLGGLGAGSVAVAHGGDAGDALQLLDGGMGSGIVLSGEAGDDLLSAQTTPAGGVTALYGGAGADRLQVLATAAGSLTAVFGEDQNDSLTVGQAGGSLSGLQGNLEIDGGAHSDLPSAQASVSVGTRQVSLTLPVGDSLTIYDSGQTAATSYALAIGSLDRSGAANISWSAVETWELDAGAGSNTIQVAGTEDRTRTVLRGGVGTDQLTIQGTGESSVLDIDTGAGADTVQLDASGRASVSLFRTGTEEDSFTLQQSGESSGVGVEGQGGNDLLTVAGSGAGAVVRLVGGDGGDQFELQSTGTDSDTAVYGSAGNDTIRLGDESHSWDGLLGAVSVSGEAHDSGSPQVAVLTLSNQKSVSVSVPSGDVMEIDDSGSAAEAVYTLTPTSVQRTGFPAITYATLELISLATGAAGDQVSVSGTAAQANTAIATGDGDDQVTVSNTAASSQLSVDVGGGADQVQLQSTGNSSYVSVLSGNSGSDQDRITVVTTGNSSGLDIQGQDDADHIEMLNVGANGIHRIRGGAGTDEMLVRASRSGSFIEIAGEADDDSTTVSGTDETLNGLLGTVLVFGGDSTGANGTANDSLHVLDSRAQNAYSYTLTEQQWQRTNRGAVQYAGIGILDLQTGAGGDTVTIQKTGTAQTTVNTGLGKDSATIQITGDAGSLDLATGDDDDTVTIQNTGKAPITVNLGLGNDRATIQTTGATGSLNLQAEDGDDTLTMENSGAGSITVDLGPGSDTAAVETTGDASSLTVQGGDDGDTISLRASGASSVVQLDGGPAADVLEVGRLTDGGQTGVRGEITATGGDGDDTLRLQLPADKYLASDSTTSLTLDGGGGIDTAEVDSARDEASRAVGITLKDAAGKNIDVSGFGGKDGKISLKQMSRYVFRGGLAVGSSDSAGDRLAITGTAEKNEVAVGDIGSSDPFQIAGYECLGLWGSADASAAVAGDVLTNNTAVLSLIVGGPGNDVLRGGSGVDVIFADGGIDKLYGSGGDDFLFADARFTSWSDVSIVNDDSRKQGDPGDVLDGGAGKNSAAQLGVNDHVLGITGKLVNGGAQQDVLTWLMAQIVPASDLARFQADLEKLVAEASDKCTAKGCRALGEPVAALLAAVRNSYDIDSDGAVTARDALLIINELNRESGQAVQRSNLASGSGWNLDVNQDGFVTPLDALRVINEVERLANSKQDTGATPAAEGEAVDEASQRLAEALSLETMNWRQSPMSGSGLSEPSGEEIPPRKRQPAPKVNSLHLYCERKHAPCFKPPGSKPRYS